MDHRTSDRIDRLLLRLRGQDELRAETEWLATRYRRLERNLEKISRISDGMQAQIMELNERLQAAAVTDPLTGLMNRRGINRLLGEAVRDDDGGGFCIALVDIDHFKYVNDTHGHDVGDEVLVEFASRFRKALRPGDHPARWGGEEFLAFLPATSTAEAGTVLDGFHELLRETPFPTEAGPLVVTASSGLAQWIGSDVSHGRTIQRADKALYLAKETGRDRWKLASAS
jgi:diguanylate cyclase (GGDEF)-like protein